MAFHIGVDVGPRETEHGADDSEGNMFGGECGARLYAVEAVEASAAEEVQKEVLDGIVGMMGCSHKGIALLTAEVGEEGIAESTRRRLDALMMVGSPRVGVEGGGVEGHAIVVSKTGHELLVAVAVAGA